MGWLLQLAMADPPIARIAEIILIAPIAAIYILCSIKCNIALLNRPLWDINKKVLRKSLLIVVRLYHHWVSTSWVDPSENHIADCIYLFCYNLRRGEMKSLYLEDQFHQCMHYYPNDECFCYHTYVIHHLLDQTLVGTGTLLIARLKHNCGYVSWWGQRMSG
jgi:hypothetical protein